MACLNFDTNAASGIHYSKKAVDKLPAELLRMILYSIVGCDPTMEPNFIISVPPALCLVNRRWNRVFAPFLYSHYAFYGNPDKIGGLWCFLRTIYTRPDLAECVRYLGLTNKHTSKRQINEEEGLRALHNFSEDNLPWGERAFCDAGLESLMDEFAIDMLNYGQVPDVEDAPDGEIYEAYTRPLIAMVIAYCPNLLRLHLHVTPENPYLTPILQYATAKLDPTEPSAPSRPALQNLHTLTLSPLPPVCDRWDRLCDELCDDCIGHSPMFDVEIGPEVPFYLLPKLKDLLVIGAHLKFDTHSSTPTTKSKQRTSMIETLRLGASNTHHTHFESLANLTPNLRKISINLGPNCSGPALCACILPVLNRFKNQLEDLNIFQEYWGTWDLDGKICASFTEFPKLRDLSIPLHIIAGSDCGHRAWERMRGHLPLNLESLCVYLGPIQIDDETLPSELVVGEIENFKIWHKERERTVRVRWSWVG
ncbi:hypothetical protein BJX76DRAFT_360084 [Aspergillus varians]